MHWLQSNSYFQLILIMLPYIVMETYSKGLLYSIYQLEQMSRQHQQRYRQYSDAGGTPSDRGGGRGGRGMDPMPYPSKKMICRTFSRHQRNMCHQHFRLMDSVLTGMLMGLNECRYQFTAHIWDCRGHNVTFEASSLRIRNIDNNHSAVNVSRNKKRRRRKKRTYLDKLLSKATPESAYVLSIISAGVAHQVTKACSKGVHDNCGCDRTIYDTPESSNFKWSGCSHNIYFGSAFTRKFLDIGEKLRLRKRPAKALTNLHNNNVGRQAVAGKMGKKCKCHGVSGSCEMQTCFRALPDFRIVGDLLKKRFNKAIRVQFVNSRLVPRISALNNNYKNDDISTNTGYRTPRIMFTNNDLIYLNPSPDFCNHDYKVGSLGTKGRYCVEAALLSQYSDGSASASSLLSSTQSSSAASSSYLSSSGIAVAGNSQQPVGLCRDLCCKRGHSRRTYTRLEQCRCKFQWCCDVKCDLCRKKVVESVCN